MARAKTTTITVQVRMTAPIGIGAQGLMDYVEEAIKGWKGGYLDDDLRKKIESDSVEVKLISKETFYA